MVDYLSQCWTFDSTLAILFWSNQSEKLRSITYAIATAAAVLIIPSAQLTREPMSTHTVAAAALIDVLAKPASQQSGGV